MYAAVAKVTKSAERDPARTVAEQVPPSTQLENLIILNYLSRLRYEMFSFAQNDTYNATNTIVN